MRAHVAVDRLAVAGGPAPLPDRADAGDVDRGHAHGDRGLELAPGDEREPGPARQLDGRVTVGEPEVARHDLGETSCAVLVAHARGRDDPCHLTHDGAAPSSCAPTTSAS